MVALPLPKLPDSISGLQSIALDLRWTWCHEGDSLWRYVNRDLWERTHNPWIVLQTTPHERLEVLATDSVFLEKLAAFVAARDDYLKTAGWFRRTEGHLQLGGVAYFSMEFGLGSALPLYAGGLGVLAGDFLKAASDLDVPVIGIGLLYQEGYFRQLLDETGMQREFYPYNEPAAMPIEPVIRPGGEWLRIALELPGRTVQLRVWLATVGRVKLYLLDSNDLLNSAPDRGITAKLYGGGTEIRLMQEIVLGVGGWRIVEALHPEIEICHVNEGHAAFAIIERARHVAVKKNLDFWDALWATRAGNIFTTHTPVAAGFDQFSASLLRKYLPYVEGVLSGHGVEMDDVLALGRLDAGNADEPFNMAYLALRGSAMCIAVSRLHGEFSRMIFQPLFPRWPGQEVPITSITNGVHTPTWDSAEADRIWTESCGKERWRSPEAEHRESMSSVSDEALWTMRGKARQRAVQFARERLAVQLRERGHGAADIKNAAAVLDPNVLTLGFARRFTEYKRPNLLLRDPQRLLRLLLDEKRPVQILVAGKAHSADFPGKQMIQQWVDFASQPSVRRHVVFLEDYDIDLAQELVQGVDVWLNTPRRPWEACGTSGMKVLVNGGLNCSILDGWWDEAYEPDLGWAIGDRSGGPAGEIDLRDGASLYELLESKIATEFYDRDGAGIPRRWVERIRTSMYTLTPAFSSTRMMREYTEKAYLRLSQAVRARLTNECDLAKTLNGWCRDLYRHWPSLHIGQLTVTQNDDKWHFDVPIYLGEILPASVRVQLFSDAVPGRDSEVIELCQVRSIPGSVNGFIYAGSVSAARSSDDYTVRVLPWHPDAILPVELPLIAWQR